MASSWRCAQSSARKGADAGGRGRHPHPPFWKPNSVKAPPGNAAHFFIRLQCGGEGAPYSGRGLLTALAECFFCWSAINEAYPNPQPWISHRRGVITDPFLVSWDVRPGVEPVISG